jgi:hypothetical protein
MSIELKTYIVAFIDLLGFSAMVKHDCETANGEQRYIESLHKIYLKTKKLKETIDGLQLIQFSDSVVLAIPYGKDNYTKFLKVISTYQYDLLETGILCRGGISYGKHFSTEDFLFSNGLIDAYRLESKVASTPRVVVSKELIELIPPSNNNNEYLSQERDGVWFVKYLNGTDDESWNAICLAISDDLSHNPSIRNKQIWLIDYYNHQFSGNVHKEIPRFSDNVA